MNRSGLRLLYWAATPAGKSTVHVLKAWEESPLLVEPVQGNVVLAETQQQASLFITGLNCKTQLLSNTKRP